MTKGENIYLSDAFFQDVHSLRLQTDFDYKHKWEIQSMLDFFEKRHFSKCEDSINSYSSNNPPLYYRHIKDNLYLVFNHYNLGVKNKDGFDCWVAKYSSKEKIGVERPLELESVRNTFWLERDLPLIEQYLC